MTPAKKAAASKPVSNVTDNRVAIKIDSAAAQKAAQAMSDAICDVFRAAHDYRIESAAVLVAIEALSKSAQATPTTISNCTITMGSTGC